MGIGDVYYEQLGNGGYDARHYTLDFSVDMETGMVTGTTTMVAEATQNLSSFNLDFQGPDLTEALLNGEPVAYERTNHELTLVLDEPLVAGTLFTSTITYQGEPEPVEPYPRLSISLGWLYDGDVVYVVSEPNGAASWYPVNDHPQDKATYSFRITAPEPYVVAANGILEEVIEGEGVRTYVWESDDPMASYLVTVNIGDYVERTAEGPDGLPIRHYFPASMSAEETAVFDKTGEMIDYFEEVFGPYPFDAYGVIVVDSDFSLALETQTLSVFGKSILESPRIEGIAAEELAHQWFGDSVSPAQWRDIWLNEGFGTYSQWLWAEHDQGPEARDELVRDRYRQVAGYDFFDMAEVSDEELEDALDDYFPPPGDPPPDDLFNGGVYGRGGLTLHALRLRLDDDETFFDILRTYTDRYRYANATTEDFIAVAEEVSGEELEDFFDAWLYADEIPDIPELDLARRVVAELGETALTLRAGPGSDYPEVGVVEAESAPQAYGEAYDCAWLRVRKADGSTGWIPGSEEYVTLSHSCDFVPESAIPAAPTPTPPPLPEVPTVNEGEAAARVEAAVRGAVGSDRVGVSYDDAGGDRIMILAYLSNLSSADDPEAFNAEVNRAVLAAVPGFLQAESEPAALFILAGGANQKLDEPAAARVLVPRETALQWYGGQLSDSAFIGTWYRE